MHNLAPTLTTTADEQFAEQRHHINLRYLRGIIEADEHRREINFAMRIRNRERAAERGLKAALVDYR